MGVVQHHLTTLPPLLNTSNVEPLHPDFSLNSPTDEQNLHTEQETTTTSRHPMFHNIRIHDKTTQI